MTQYRVEHLHVARGRNASQRWCIWHTASDQIVLWGYRSRAAALRELDHVAGLTDWSRTAGELLDDPALRTRMLDGQVRIAHGRPVPTSSSVRHA